MLPNPKLALILFVSCILAAAAHAVDTNYPKTLEQYEMLRAGLAADDLAAAKNGATNLVVAASEELGEKAISEPSQNLAASESLEDARKQFQLVSIEIEKLVKGQPGFFIMTCPMAPGSVWVQTTREVNNPYKGKAMLECGEIKK